MSGTGKTLERPAPRRSTRPTATRKRATGRSKPVSRVLPPSVLSTLKESMSNGAEVTASLVAKLDEELAIEKRYGVSRRRLANHLKRLHATSLAPTSALMEKRDDAGPTDAAWGRRVAAHRRRQASVAAILERTFGATAQCKPELWERRAYLMLIGLVYERLSTGEEDISTDDLVALAKVLAEHRRVEVRLRDNHRGQEPEPREPNADEAMPPRLADTVRRLYGTNFDMPVGSDAS